MLVANGYGRIEIDPLRIIARAYATFNPRPTEEDVQAWIREYTDANLLFLYEYDGQTWGQWDTPERLLAKYKLAADKRSPAPPEPAFTNWKSNYRATSTALPRSYETLSKDSPKLCENSPSGVGEGIGDGNGDGVGIGVGGGFHTDIAFEELWQSYPQKGRVKKPLAEGQYFELMKPLLDPVREETHAAIMTAVKGKWAASKLWAEGFVQGLADFIQLRRWREDPEPAITAIPKIPDW
jgi:hypothetical protein